MLKTLVLGKEECIKPRIHCLYLNNPVQASLLIQINYDRRKKKMREKYAEEITSEYIYIYTVTENMICFAS